jgi:hypothetical protein
MITLITLTAATGVLATDDNRPDDIKQLKGMFLMGDKEAPKSLYIVPWHDAEHKQNTSLSSDLIDSELRAVDRDSLMRQLRLYELSKSGWHRLSPAAP